MSKSSTSTPNSCAILAVEHSNSTERTQVCNSCFGHDRFTHEEVIEVQDSSTRKWIKQQGYYRGWDHYHNDDGFEDETYWERHLKYEKVAFMLLDRFDDMV
jgi:hypothetical protein